MGKRLIYFDAKMTVWERFTIETEMSNEEIEQYLKEGVSNGCCENRIGIGEEIESETLFDTMEYMTLTENDNNATIDIIDYETNEEIANNGGNN